MTAYETASPEDRERLNRLLDGLRYTILSSRDNLARYLQSFDEEVLSEAWRETEIETEGQSQPPSSPPPLSEITEQIPLDFSAGPLDGQLQPQPQSPFLEDESHGRYRVTRPVTIEEMSDFIRTHLEERFRRTDILTSPDETKNYLTVRLADLPHEVFASIFLDNKHRVIEYEELFRGTIDGASVHPREVVKAALRHNAAAVIFAHNHPSGVADPSDADRYLTKRLKDALSLVDVRVLDHIIVGGAETVSFAERELL